MFKKVIELLALALIAAGCGGQVGADNDDDVIVPAGKEDDFYSTSGAEY